MFSDKTVIGLDIGSDSIKMVESHNSDSGNKLLTYGIAKHSLSLEGYWDSNRLRQIATIVEQILNSGDFSGVKTVMSVQSKDVYVTTMDFEASWNKHMIQEEIDRQAPYFLPYPADEMRLSWSVIKDDPAISQYTNKQRIIINALPDFVVENSRNLLEHVNLDGAALENQTVSQIRALLSPDTGNTVMVDIGSNHTTFSILVDGILRSSSNVMIGTKKISTEISTYLGVEAEIGEYFKKDLGLVNLFELPNQINDNLTILKSELDTFVDLNRRLNQIPSKVVVTGGGAQANGFLEFFKGYKIPVYHGSSLRYLTVSDYHRPYISPLMHQLSTAIGLSLRSDV